MRNILLFVIFSILSISLKSQVIRGVVTDPSGNPLPGVNIYIKGTSMGSASDQNGFYQFNAKPGKVVLVYKMLGFAVQELNLTLKSNAQTSQDVILQPDDQTLNEFVVVSDNRDFARDMVRKVQDKRKTFYKSGGEYSSIDYCKTSILKNYSRNYWQDTIIITKDSIDKRRESKKIERRKKKEQKRLEKGKVKKEKKLTKKEKRRLAEDSLAQTKRDTIKSTDPNQRYINSFIETTVLIIEKAIPFHNRK